MQSVAMLVAVRPLEFPPPMENSRKVFGLGEHMRFQQQTRNPGLLCFGMPVVVLLPFAKARFRNDELLEGSRALFCVMIMLSAICHIPFLDHRHAATKDYGEHARKAQCDLQP